MYPTDTLTAAAHALSGHRHRTSHLHLPDGADQPVAAARRHIRATLTAWGLPEADVDDATLIVSELVTNAEQHTDGGSVDVQLILRGRGLHELVIAVRDTDPHVPQAVGLADVEAESGRGLDIVDQLTTRRGCAVSLDCKTVWAALPIHDAPEGRLLDHPFRAVLLARLLGLLCPPPTALFRSRW